MILSSLLSTVAGKVVVGLAVATTGVGAAAAAGVDVPRLATANPATSAAEPSEDEPMVQALEEPAVEEPAVEEPAVEEPAVEEPAVEEPAVEEPAAEVANHGAVVSTFVHETELEGCAKGQATAAVARGDVVPGPDGTVDPAAMAEYLAGLDVCQEDGESDADADAPDDTPGDLEPTDVPNHGEVVSTFVHETELEGCAKGQATAAVARGDIVPGPDGTIDPAAVTEYLAGIDQCATPELEPEPEPAPEPADDSRTEQSGPPAHAGRPEEPGPPAHAGRPDQPGPPAHAGPPTGRGPNG